MTRGLRGSALGFAVCIAGLGFSVVARSATHASPASLPWHDPFGALAYFPQSGVLPIPVCTGSLLSDRDVLTSASCLGVLQVLVDSGEVRDNTVFWFTGADFNAPSIVPIAVLGEAVLHPEFEATEAAARFDMAIVRLNSADPDSVKACITDLEPQLVNQNVRTVGWGSTFPGADDYGIRRTALSRWSTVEADSGTEEWRLTSDADTYGMACEGDFGGPVLVGSTGDFSKFAVLGVVSSTSAPCDPDEEFGHTYVAQVAAEAAFILSTVPDVEFCRNIQWEEFGAWEGNLEPMSGCEGGSCTTGAGRAPGWLVFFVLAVMRSRRLDTCRGA